MSSQLSAAAKQAMAEGKTAEGKVLRLLADASSMMLKPKRNNEPFAPVCVMEGRRSALPEDFSEAEIAFFAAIVAQVDDIRLRGRLADLTWLCSKPRDPNHALMAIDAYRQLDLDAETWLRDGSECWERAIRLALTLGDGSGDRLIEMRDAILAAFNAATPIDGYLGIWLSDLLDEHRLARNDARSIGEHLEKLAKDFQASGYLPRYRDYYDRASRWFHKAGDSAKSAEMIVAFAEGWVREAETRASSDRPSHRVAASFYENAIQVYRTIPRTERGPHKVDERMDELRNLLNEAGEKSLGEMGVISTPGTDISEMIKQAEEAVRGKTPADALDAFANLYRVDVKTIRDSAIQTIKEHPLMGLFPATMISGDGRVVAKQAGTSLGESEAGEDESAIWFQMTRHYSIIISLIVQGNILPALDVLMQEHRLRESDFAGLCMQSPIVPKDRARLWGKALYEGYDQDFVAAIHLLCPQIENMVRVHLKAAGAKTTTLSRQGIETENGLSTLMELPEVEEVLGSDLAFEIRALFCNAFGSNLRNEVAHGLLSFERSQSVYSIYAWWLGLRLVFNTYWNAVRKVNNDDSTE